MLCLYYVPLFALACCGCRRRRRLYFQFMMYSICDLLLSILSSSVQRILHMGL